VPPDGALTVASYNVKNLAATSPRSRFAALARQIVEALHAPRSSRWRRSRTLGPQGRRHGLGRAHASQAHRRDRRGGRPAYRAVALSPEDDGTAGRRAAHPSGLPAARGGRARRGRRARARRAGSRAWTSARKPLALRVEWAGPALLLLANHWSSRLADDADFGARQPPQRPSSERRVAQAAVVAAYLDARLAAEPGLGAIVLGDFNDCESSPALANLQGDGRLECLTGDVPAGRRHTTLFEGERAGPRPHPDHARPAARSRAHSSMARCTSTSSSPSKRVTTIRCCSSSRYGAESGVLRPTARQRSVRRNMDTIGKAVAALPKAAVVHVHTLPRAPDWLAGRPAHHPTSAPSRAESCARLRAARRHDAGAS
jgi:hypothetical protein